MAIKGLTDRGLSFPEIGQIRKGAKKTGNRPGEDLQYFRVEFDERETKAAAEFQAVYGAQPQAIRIILPFNEIERMWDAWLEAYTAGRMIARSDGEIFTYLIDTRTNRPLVKNGIDIATGQPRPYVEDQPVGYYSSNGKDVPIFCRPSGRLKVIIPELARAAYLTVLTTSIHDIINISEQLRAFQTLNDGQLAGIPLVLRRRPKSISTPNADGTRARRAKWLLSIEADPEWVKARLMATKKLALPGNGVALLPQGETGEYEPDAGDVSGLENDHDEGEFEEGEYKDLPIPEAPEAPPSNGNGSARPYPPETVKIKITELAAKAEAEGWVLKDGARNMLAVNLEACFAGEADSADKRHTVLKWLTGQASTKDLTNGQAMALSKWLDSKPDSGGAWMPDGMSIKEARAIHALALQSSGQTTLF